jgi:hypothetical protein
MAIRRLVAAGAQPITRLSMAGGLSAIGRPAQRGSARSLTVFATTQALPALYSNGGCGRYGPRKSRAPSAKTLAVCSALC